MSDTGDRPFLPFGAPQIGEEEIAEVVETLRSGWIGTGPRVHRFEREFAAYKGVDHAAAVGSCTAALHLALLAAGVGPGDEVVTTPLTFCATVNSIIHAGATPVLADVDRHTMNLDPAAVDRVVGPRTRAMVPVHFAGRPCDMDALGAIAKKHGLMIIEDCAHAIETEASWGRAGTYGDFGCFSFYVTKNLVTAEGGMVLARDDQSLERIRRLALHGMSRDAWKRFGSEGYRHYQVVEAGFKYNMTDIQAALGIHQLARVEDNWRMRQRLWDAYQNGLRSLPLALPEPSRSGTRHGHHLYTVLLDEASAGMGRDTFLDRLTKEGIGVGVHYLSLPEHPFYQEQLGWNSDRWPVARDIGRTTVSLPLYPAMSEGDVERVCEAVRRILNR